MKICKLDTAETEVRTEPTIYFTTYTPKGLSQKVPHITWKPERRQGPKKFVI